MLVRKLVMATVLSASMLAGMPSVAQAHDDRGWHRGHYDHDDDRGRHWGRGYYAERGPRYDGHRRGYYHDCRTSGTTGLIVGGAAGALLGRSIDRYGDRTPGTVIGAGAGALLGREVDRNHRC